MAFSSHFLTAVHDWTHHLGASDPEKEWMEELRLPEIRDPWLLGQDATVEGIRLFLAGDLVAAQEVQERCLSDFRESGDRFQVINALCNLGFTHYFSSDWVSLRSCAKEAVARFQELGCKGLWLLWCVELLIAVACGEGIHELAATLLGAVEVGRKTFHYAVEPSANPTLSRMISDISTSLSEEDSARFYENGHGMTLEQALSLGVTTLN